MEKKSNKKQFISVTSQLRARGFVIARSEIPRSARESNLVAGNIQSKSGLSSIFC